MGVNIYWAFAMCLALCLKCLSSCNARDDAMRQFFPLAPSFTEASRVHYLVCGHTAMGVGPEMHPDSLTLEPTASRCSICILPKGPSLGASIMRPGTGAYSTQRHYQPILKGQLPKGGKLDSDISGKA